MTQAEGHIARISEHSLTRRAALIGLAAVAAPASAGAVCIAPDPDAALIEAGRDFDRLVELFADAQRRSKPNWDAWCKAKKQLPRPATNAEYMSAWTQVDREYPIAFPTCDDVVEMIDEPWGVIVTTPAKTLAGALVKARVARWDHFKAWDGRPFADLDCDEQAVRSLVEAVEALAVRS